MGLFWPCSPLLLLGIETFYAVHRPLHLDEFGIAWDTAQLINGIPYVDYQPYKPVLGSYVLLAFLYMRPDTWGGFLCARLGMAYLSATVLSRRRSLAQAGSSGQVPSASLTPSWS